MTAGSYPHPRLRLLPPGAPSSTSPPPTAAVHSHSITADTDIDDHDEYPAGHSRIPPGQQHSSVAPNNNPSARPRGRRHESIACALPDVTHDDHDQDEDEDDIYADSYPYSRHHAAGSTTTHSSAALLLPPRATTTPLRQQRYDVRAARSHTPSTSVDFDCTAADKVDSRQQSAAPSVNKKAHSRLASFGRTRLRGIVQNTSSDVPHQGETLPRVPVSPSDVSSQDKRSAASTRSNTSSETTLTENSKSDIKSVDDRPSREDAATWLDQERHTSEYPDTESYERLLRRSPRMMHQTSSKLLRMTTEDRPFWKDFADLFATLVVSLPLTSHRVRFSRYDHTFTTSEAVTNLGSLKFSQSNRMPDPKDPSRIVTTTTTTTFSMATEMGRNMCLRFLESRLIESVDGRTDFNSRSSVWQLTPKGMNVLQRFCQRNGIHQRHINDMLDSPKNNLQLVLCERDPESDDLMRDHATIEVLFRRFSGDNGPNVKSSSTGSDSDSMNDYGTGLGGTLFSLPQL